MKTTNKSIQKDMAEGRNVEVRQSKQRKEGPL
jgi:hypothetical protein